MRSWSSIYAIFFSQIVTKFYFSVSELSITRRDFPRQIMSKVRIVWGFELRENYFSKQGSGLAIFVSFFSNYPSRLFRLANPD